MQRILVTGANKGIGLALTAAILDAGDDTFVFLGSRDLPRGRAAEAQLLSAHPERKGRVQVVELDVCSRDSVQAAAAIVQAEGGTEAHPLTGIVNNAGVGLGSPDLPGTLDVNVSGIQRVCRAFIPLLDPANGRIVNMTSASGPTFVARCGPDRQAFFLNERLSMSALDAFVEECLLLGHDQAAFAERGLSDGNPYGLSKACANTLTLILAREHPQLHVNACTPGFIETDLTRPYLSSEQKTAEELGMKPPSEGTRAALFLLFGELRGNGRYYGSDAERSPLNRYRAPGSPPFTGD